MKPRNSRTIRQLAIVVCGLLHLAPGTASGQERESPTLMFAGLVGTGAIDSELGLTGGVGAALGTSEYVVRALFDLHLLQPEDSGYSWELGSVGPECRDDQSGAIVPDSYCSIARALAGISTEAVLIIPALRGGLQFGGGYRIGSGSTAYGLVGYGFNPDGGDLNVLIRLAAGRNLLGLQAVLTLPFRNN